MDFSVSKIISGTMAIVRERFGPLLGLWAIFFAANIAILLVFGLALGGSILSVSSLENPEGLGAGMIVSMIIAYFVYFLVSLAQVGSMNAMASPLQKLSFADALSAGARSAPTLLGAAILLMIAYFICAIALGVLGGLLAMAGKAGTVILLLLVIPPILYLVCRMALIAPVAAVERVSNPVAVITRSWALTKGNVLTIFLTFLVFAVVAFVAVGLLFVPLMGMMASIKNGAAEAPSLGSMAAAIVGVFIVSVLLSIVSATLSAVMHGALSGSTGQASSDTFS